jgi:hypothetical protein
MALRTLDDDAQAPAQPDNAREASPAAIQDRLRSVGQDLGRTLSAVLAGLPGAPLRPNQLAQLVGVNRAVASRVLSATGKRDPMETLHLVPGPEPLRRLVRTAVRRGVPSSIAADAEQAIRQFDLLIRNDAGTRAALDAMISSSLPGARERFELASKYSVYKGLSQLKGVQGEHWVGTAVVAPSADDELKHDLTWLNGAIGMQRLRPGVSVRFSYRHRRGDELVALDGDGSPALGVVPLDEFCVNPPARLEAQATEGTIQYTLPDDLLGPHQVVDMFVVDHHPAAMRRYASDAPRHRNSLFVEPAIPVGMLVFDVILHEDAYPGSEPRLIIYDTGYDGIANVNDPDRDLDRVDVQDSVQFIGHDMSRFSAIEFPRYGDALLHLADRFGWDPQRFRGYRTRIRYPVFGWQVCLSFEPPPAPDA